MNQDHHIKLLRVIQDLATLPIPYSPRPPEAEVDGALISALGQIAGICIRTLLVVSTPTPSED